MPSAFFASKFYRICWVHALDPAFQYLGEGACDLDSIIVYTADGNLGQHIKTLEDCQNMCRNLPTDGTDACGFITWEAATTAVDYPASLCESSLVRHHSLLCCRRGGATLSRHHKALSVWWYLFYFPFGMI